LFLSSYVEGYTANSIDSNMPITPDMAKPFHASLIKDGIQRTDHDDDRKWLRYYLDFCHKYHPKELQVDRLKVEGF